MHRDDVVRLQHMLDASNEAMEFAKGKTRNDLAKNRMLVLALVKAVEIIGEASYRINEDTRHQLPDVPWEDIIGMRHRLVHAYFDINLDILWKTVTEDLSMLNSLLEPILDRIKSG